MTARRGIVATVAVAGALLLTSSCSKSPADRVLDDLADRRPDDTIAVDAAGIDRYAPDACARMREARTRSGQDVRQFSTSLAAAPPGTHTWLPVQELTADQLTDLNEAVADQFCVDLLP